MVDCIMHLKKRQDILCLGSAQREILHRPSILMPFQAILNDHRNLIHPPKVFIYFFTHRSFDHIKRLVKYSNISTSYLRPCQNLWLSSWQKQVTAIIIIHNFYY